MWEAYGRFIGVSEDNRWLNEWRGLGWQFWKSEGEAGAELMVL
jgi:hypothetical protein